MSISNPALDTFYIPTVISDSTYAWSKKRTQTYAVKSVLVTYDFKTQYQQDISNLTSCIVKNLDTLQQGNFHPKWREVDPQDYKAIQWGISPVAQKVLDRKAQ